MGHSPETTEPIHNTGSAEITEETDYWELHSPGKWVNFDRYTGTVIETIDLNELEPTNIEGDDWDDIFKVL